MALTSTTNKITQNCNGALTAFDFTFPITEASDLQVIMTLISTGVEQVLALTTNYAVVASSNDFANGGTVTTVATWSALYTITIYRNVPITQPSTFTENMQTLYQTFEDGLNRLTMIDQAQEERIDSALKTKKSDSDATLELPIATDRASRYLAFDASGEPIASSGSPDSVVPVSAFMETLLDDTTALQARATLGSVIGTNVQAYSARATAAEDLAGAEATKAIAPLTNPQLIKNLKPVVNASVNKLDIFTKSGGAIPDASNIISVAIPDGNGYTFRSRAADYLSGTSQFIMADAANYWSKGSLDAEIKTAYVYAIWDAAGGIVWALGGYSGFTRVPASTTATDDDFFLLEASSTYTKVITDYCVCVGKIRYQYDTADTPDHTIQATVLDAPQVMWNPKSDYGYQKNLATTLTQASDIAEYSAISVVVKQSGWYNIIGKSIGISSTATFCYAKIKTGSVTYASAVQKARGFQVGGDGYTQTVLCFASTYLNAGDTIHLGAWVEGTAGNNRVLYGDSSSVGSTQLVFFKED